MDRRKQFFESLISTRRRENRRWQTTPLSKLFLLDSEDHFNRLGEMVELIKHSIQGQGLSFLDACQMYDTDGDGWLSAMEVIQAVTHLDNAVNPKDIATLLKFADADGDGEGEGGKRCRVVCVMLCDAVCDGEGEGGKRCRFVCVMLCDACV